MPTTSRTRILALAGAVLLLAILAAGCARRGQPAAAGTTEAPTASFATAPTPSAAPVATSRPTPTGSPVPTPDLSSIEALVKDIDNDLNADATAGANEGSTP